MSKAVKTVVGVVAAIAVPIVAPQIAAAIKLSTAIGSALGSTTAGSVIGGALTGAALGGVTQAALGGDVRRGALLGAIGGGIGGYTSAASASALPPAPRPGLTLAPRPGLTLAPQSSFSLAPQSSFSLGPSNTFGGVGSNFIDALGPNPFADVDYSLASGLQSPTVGFDSASAGAQSALAADTPIDYSLTARTPSFADYSGGSYAGLTSTGATPLSSSPVAKPTTFIEALKQVPKEIANKFSDPKVLADLTLRAAGNLAGSALAGDGLTDQERALLNAQTEELRKLQQTNIGLFNQRLEQAMNIIGESRYFDPEYFGLQSARRVQTASARAKRAGLRGLEGAQRAAEARRFDLATARDAATAFDQGYMQGISGRLNTLQTGVGLMPTGYPSSMGDYTNLRTAYADASERARKRAQDIGSLFGSITGRDVATSRG